MKKSDIKDAPVRRMEMDILAAQVEQNQNLITDLRAQVNLMHAFLKATNFQYASMTTKKDG